MSYMKKKSGRTPYRVLRSQAAYYALTNLGAANFEAGNLVESRTDATVAKCREPKLGVRGQICIGDRFAWNREDDLEMDNAQNDNLRMIQQQATRSKGDLLITLIFGPASPQNRVVNESRPVACNERVSDTPHAH